MPNFNEVSIKTVPINYKETTVITTEMLASVYKTETNNIQANFTRNKDKFEEGKHYILLQGEELRNFKNQPTSSQVVKKNASQLYLWTERGANRHCKILDTDKAWEQFENLEETYFKVKEQFKPLSMEDMMIAQLEEQKKIKHQISQVNSNALEAINVASNVEHKLNTQMTINSTQQKHIQDAVKKRVTERLHRCKEFDLQFDTVEHKAQFFSSLYGDLKRRFGVPTYKDILFVDYEDAINYAKSWIEPDDIR